MKQKVVIIGAGIGGLALANILQKSGYNVEVFEKNNQLGGRAGQETIDGFRFDTGPSWYLMPEVFDHYFRLFDVDAQKALRLKKLAPAYKVFFQSHKPLTIEGDLKKDYHTFDSIEPGAGDMLKQYVQESDERYNLALKHFLYTNFSHIKPFLHRDITSRLDILTNALTTSLHKRVAKSFHSLPLQQILEYPMVFLGTSPFSAPSLYSLMSALDFKNGVYYPQNGIYAIIEELIKIGKSLGVSYRLDADVTSIITNKKHATGITLSDGTLIDADVVISNADLHFTETELLPKAARSFDKTYWKKKESGISALLLYAGYKGDLSSLEHHNLFFGDQWKETFDDIYTNKQTPRTPSFYVSRTTSTDPSTAPKGYENLFILVPLPTKKVYTQSELTKLSNQTIAQLGKMVGKKQFTKNISIKKVFGPNDFTETFNAWEGTALGPSHILTQSAFFRTPNKSKKLKNLYYVGGATTPGIGLPMCLISAELVYKRMINDHTAQPIKSIRKRS